MAVKEKPSWESGRQVSPWTCYLCSHKRFYLCLGGPMLDWMLCFVILKLLIILNQGSPHFHFVLGLINLGIYRYLERRLLGKWRVNGKRSVIGMRGSSFLPSWVCVPWCFRTIRRMWTYVFEKVNLFMSSGIKEEIQHLKPS